MSSVAVNNLTGKLPATVSDKPIREIESFTYLGSTVDKQGAQTVTSSRESAKQDLPSPCSRTSGHLKRSVSPPKSNVKSVLLLYGSETWRTTKASMKKIQTFFNTCLRRILNIRLPERISNEDLWRRTKQQPMDVQIRQRKWRWIEHTLRKPPSSTTRQALLWIPQGKRKRGRPRNSWRRDTDSKLRENNMFWQEATRAAQHRVRWRTFVDGLCSSRNDRPK